MWSSMVGRSLTVFLAVLPPFLVEEDVFFLFYFPNECYMHTLHQVMLVGNMDTKAHLIRVQLCI